MMSMCQHCLEKSNVSKLYLYQYCCCSEVPNTFPQVQINTIFERKIVNIFLLISFIICFGCFFLMEMVLLSWLREKICSAHY